MNKKPYALIFLVVLAAGCIEGLPFFGSDIVSVQKSILEDKTKDVLVMRDVFLDQGTNLIPNLQMRLEFLIENQDDQKSARNVRVDLFSAALMKSADGQFCDSSARPCKPDKCGLTNPCTSILPLDTKQITFTIRAPDERDIGGIKQETTLDYRTFYDFEGTMTYSLPVVNIEEIRKRRRADETTTVVESKSFGSGPVKVDVELQGPQYMLADQSAVILFTVNDKGSGNLKNSVIDPWSSVAPGQPGFYGMHIEFPRDVQILEWPGGTPEKQEENALFRCDAATNVCTNIRAVELYKDVSRVSMRFKIKLADAVYGPFVAQEIPFRYYQIKTNVGYTYELRESTGVTINPYQNV